MERLTIEHDSCVQVSEHELSSILSRAGHEESCLNPPGPPGKAKYFQETDSVPVL